MSQYKQLEDDNGPGYQQGHVTQSPPMAGGHVPGYPQGHVIQSPPMAGDHVPGYPQGHVIQGPPMAGGHGPGYPQGQVLIAQPIQTQTHVIVQQPRPQHGPSDWSSGLFDCTDDLGICVCAWFCGICLACQVSKDMDESMCVPCCFPLPIAILRTKWRTQHGIQGSIMNDCLLNAFCGQCALCQLAREVKVSKGL